MRGRVVGKVAAALPTRVKGEGGARAEVQGSAGHLACGWGRWRLGGGAISAATTRAMTGMVVGLGLHRVHLGTRLTPRPGGYTRPV